MVQVLVNAGIVQKNIKVTVDGKGNVIKVS